MKVTYGSGDLIAELDAGREEAAAGELEAVVVITITTDKVQAWRAAWKEDMAVPWARLVAGVASCQQELLTEGI